MPTPHSRPHHRSRTDREIIAAVLQQRPEIDVIDLREHLGELGLSLDASALGTHLVALGHEVHGNVVRPKAEPPSSASSRPAPGDADRPRLSPPFPKSPQKAVAIAVACLLAVIVIAIVIAQRSGDEALTPTTYGSRHGASVQASSMPG